MRKIGIAVLLIALLIPATTIAAGYNSVYDSKLKYSGYASHGSRGEGMGAVSADMVTERTFGELLNSELKLYYDSVIIIGGDVKQLSKGSSVADNISRTIIKAGLNLDAMGNPDLLKVYTSCTDVFVLDCDSNSKICSFAKDERSGISCNPKGYILDEVISYIENKDSNNDLEYKIKSDKQSVIETAIRKTALPKILYINLAISNNTDLTDKAIEKHLKIRNILPNTHIEIVSDNGISSEDKLNDIINKRNNRKFKAQKEIEVIGARNMQYNKQIIELSEKQLVDESDGGKTFILKDTVKAARSKPYLYGFYVLNVLTEPWHQQQIRADNDVLTIDRKINNPSQPVYTLTYYVANCYQQDASHRMTKHHQDILDSSYMSINKDDNVCRVDGDCKTETNVTIGDEVLKKQEADSTGNLASKIYSSICKSDSIVTNIINMSYDHNRELLYYTTEDGQRLYFMNDSNFTCNVCYKYTNCHIVGKTTNDNLLFDVKKAVAQNRHGKKTVCNNGKIITDVADGSDQENADEDSNVVEIIDNMIRSNNAPSIQAEEKMRVSALM